jgi:hypothetical protein
MSWDLRRWLIAILGATLPIPFAIPVPESRTGHVPVDTLIWPVAIVILLVISPHEWAILRRDRLARLVLAFLAVSALSLPVGLIVFHNLDGLRSYGYQVVLMANLVAGYLFLRSLGDVELLLKSFVAATGVVAIALAGYLLRAGILASVHAFHNDLALINTVYGWPNAFSVLLSSALVMGLYVISTARTRSERIAFAVLTAGIAVCSLLTFSKTGWVALALALWLLWLRSWRVYWQLLLLAGLFVAGVVVLHYANESLRTQLFTLGTLNERVLILANVLRDVHPLILIFGSGSESVQTLLIPYANQILVPGVTMGSRSTHDEFLEILVKSGVLGLVLFVWALAVVMLRIRKLASIASGRLQQLSRYWYAASWATVISLLAGEQLHYWPAGALFWLMAGALIQFVAGVRREVIEAPLEPQAGEAVVEAATRSPRP